MQVEEEFKKYITAFEKRLELVVIDDISTELQCKKYLVHLLRHKRYYLAMYADVLNKLTRHSSQKRSDMVLIDFGSGNGLLGLFSKFCGFKKVFLNDLNVGFIDASKKLAGQLNISLDGFLTGDIHAAQNFFVDEVPHAIIGTDVIEHIYSPESFFRVLQEMNPSMVTVFTTASNPANYFKVRSLKKIQLKDELTGSTPGDHILSGESALEPFLLIRERIIRKHSREFPDSKIPEFANATRGLHENDIKAAVDHFHNSGKLPVPPAHPTNTCNPFSGSWTERILSFKEYILLYHSSGFKPTFYNGFYNVYDGRWTKYAKIILNAAIHVFGKNLAPYIIIAGCGKNGVE